MIRFYDFKDDKLPSLLKQKSLKDEWFLAFCRTENQTAFYQTYKVGMLLEPKTSRYVIAIKPINESKIILFEKIKELEI
jgi:hypothetical protein